MSFFVVSGTVPFDPTSSQESFGAGNTIVYDADTQSFTLHVTAGAAKLDKTFSPADIQVIPVTQVTVYRNGTASLTIVKPGDAGAGLQYVTSGSWGMQPDPDQKQGYFVFGIPTTTDTMPHSGSATFEGSAGGMLISSGKQYGLSGTSTITANFGTGAVTGAFSMTKTDPTTTLVSPWRDLTVSATISGTGYAGTLGGGTGDDAISGPLSGGFFGPGAPETGGSWSLNNTLEHGVGTFMGKKK